MLQNCLDGQHALAKSTDRIQTFNIKHLDCSETRMVKCNSANHILSHPSPTYILAYNIFSVFLMNFLCRWRMSKETIWVSCLLALHLFLWGSNPTKHQSSRRWAKYNNFPLMKTWMTDASIKFLYCTLLSVS